MSKYKPLVPGKIMGFLEKIKIFEIISGIKKSGRGFLPDKKRYLISILSSIPAPSVPSSILIPEILIVMNAPLGPCP